MITLDAEFEQIIQFLYTQLPMFQRDGASAYKKDLYNTHRLCEFLGHPEHQFKSVHVAGTNGKGSSSHFLAAICQQAGYKTGLYTSPHLKTFTERIKINGQEITKEAVVDFVNRIKPLIEEIKPSFFEITVAMCFDYFARQNVDIAIIEVGMGGRLDSTNVVLPEVSLITNISKDHQQFLGNTLEAIAGEKAGIIKQYRPVVISERQPDIEHVFKNKAKTLNAAIYFAQDQYKVTLGDHLEVYSEGKPFIDIQKYQMASYQQNNLAGVLQTIAILQERGFIIKKDDIVTGISKAFELTGLKGRWQQLRTNPYVFCDVGHNEAGMGYVLQQIGRYEYNQLHLILGMVNDKDIDQILAMLPKNAKYYFCQANIPRALAAEILQEKASRYGLSGRCIKNVNEALKEALEGAKSDDFIFIGGSNFLVAEIDGL